MFNYSILKLVVNFKLFEFAGVLTCSGCTRVEMTSSRFESDWVLQNIHISKSARPGVLVFSDHLANFRMVVFVHTEVYVVIIGFFIGFVDGSFYSVCLMLVDDFDVASRVFAFVVNVLVFHDAKHFTMSDINFHEGHRMFSSDGDYLSLGNVNEFRANIRDQDTECLSSGSFVDSRSC